jgi:hypothetical protein
MCVFCNVWVCVCVSFVMCGWVCVYRKGVGWGLGVMEFGGGGGGGWGVWGGVGARVWMCGFFNVWVCVCVSFVMCGCVYVWVL